MKNPSGRKLLPAGLAVLVLLLAACYFIGKPYIRPAEQKIEILPVNSYDETVVVVADIDYEPFSFVGSDGNPSGYDVELLYAAADKMQVNIEIRLMNWSECKAAVASGEADMITGIDYRQGGYPGIILSRAMNNDRFVCFGKKNFSNVSELYHKKLAALNQSGSLTEFLEPYQLVENTTFYATYTEVMQSVISGENDYAIARYSVGRRTIAKLNDRSMHAVGPSIANNTVCIGVNGDKAYLLEPLNLALDELTSDGTLHFLSNKWLGTYVELISFMDFVRVYNNIIYILAGCLIILIVTVAFYIYSGNARAAHSEQEKRLKEKELELAESRIDVMLSQIRPHFLYNSLVVIKQLCELDPPKAQEAVTEFAGYLRGNLDSITQKRPIPFEKELKHVENYLALEQKRFGDRVRVKYDIQASGFMLPALTVQPIVENAIRYGITKKEAGGTVTISATEEEGDFVITVSDDGMGFAVGQSTDNGRSHIGIDNVRGRVKAMCNGSLSVESIVGQGTVVTITIPKEA